MASTVSRYHPWRVLGPMLLGVALLIGWAFWPGASNAPQLGLDLQGGTQVTLLPTAAPGTEGSITQEQLDQAVTIIRQRVDGLGVAESEVTVQGSGDNAAIIVSVPGSVSQDRLVDLVGRTAQLAFRQVEAITNPEGVDPNATPSAEPTPSITPTPTEASPTPTDAAASASASPDRCALAVGRPLRLGQCEPECQPQRQPGGEAAEDTGPGQGEHHRVPGARAAPGLHVPGEPRGPARCPGTVVGHLRPRWNRQVPPAAHLHQGHPGHQRDRRARPADEQVVRLAELRHRGRQEAGRDLDGPLRQHPAAEPVRHRPRRRGLQRPLVPRAHHRRAGLDHRRLHDRRGQRPGQRAEVRVPAGQPGGGPDHLDHPDRG